MPARKNQLIAQQAYNQIAEDYAALVDTKAHNAYYERPAMLSLLPDVNGLHVLDAGCGPGVYSQWLAEHGAQVVALDANRKMVRLARKRLGDKAQVLLAELGKPLDFAADASFDLIVAPLVMDYVKDWSVVFKEFHRILKSGGVLLFSMEHPFGKFYAHQATSNYYDTDLVHFTWRGFGPQVDMPSYRRPLNAVLNPLIQAGLCLDYLLEPLPTEQFRAVEPEDYEKLIRSPGFMCIRAVKRS